MSSVAEPPAGPAQPLEAVAEESLRFFYESSPLLMGTVALCPDGDLLHLYDNPATSQFFGGEAGATHGKTARSLGVPEETIALWYGHYEAAGRQGASVTFEYDHPHPEGTRRLSVTVAPLGVESPLGYPQFSYVAQDVTEAHAADAARRQAQERLGLATRASGLGVWEWNLQTNEIVHSARALEIYGLAAGPAADLRPAGRPHPAG